MSLKTVSLMKLSVCPCGFTLLKEEIKLGQVYRIDPDLRGVASLKCGGCGNVIRNIPVVWVMARTPGGRSDYLPEEIFDCTPDSRAHDRSRTREA